MIKFQNVLIAASILASLISVNALAFPINFGLKNPRTYFYSQLGHEHEVKFSGVYRTEFSSLAEIRELPEERRQFIIKREILPLMDFLFGPLVNRSEGSPQRSKSVSVNWDRAELSNGKIELPYEYKGLWIVSNDVSVAGKVDLPVPLNRKLVFSNLWKECTDSAPEHQTQSFYWYFWDPERDGCDQKVNVQYKIVTVEIGNQTQQTEASYPEYNRMLADGVLSMTLGFGYVQDPAAFHPDSDRDAGAVQYQNFVKGFRRDYGSQLKEEPILQGEYLGSSQRQLIIGHRFSGTMNGAKTEVNILMSAGIDQMEIFAKSFAHDHDDMFSWFGHSRVGSGFDAERFGYMLSENPGYYSISDAYQIIYWAGCNSYSYYTLPFFEFKGGTKNLDIIANGLPSLFSFNADNAMITARYFLDWPRRASYQTIVNALEKRAGLSGVTVLVAVLGDEDNPQ